MDVPYISKPVLSFFRWIVRGFFRAHFTAVRVSRRSNLKSFDDERLIVYANHASWWDPMVCVRGGQVLMPQRKHYAPMDEESLAKNSILARIGIFGVKKDSRRGAVQFLSIGKAVVEAGDVLWVTPQGRFADVRERPLAFKPGLSMLAAKVKGGCTVLPLAIEYVYWDERRPEVLLHFGEAVKVESGNVQELSLQLDAALLRSMDCLKQLALTRDASEFQMLSELER